MTNTEFSNMDKNRVEEWAAGMRAEAGVLERSAETLEEVVVENERGGYESYAEDMAARAYRRLAAYLRRDAAAALEFAASQTDLDQDNYVTWAWTPDVEGIDALKQTPYALRAARAAAQAAHDAAAAALDTAAHIHREVLDAVAAIVRDRAVSASAVEAANGALRASYADIEAARAAAATARDGLYDACAAVRYAERRARADAIDAARAGARPAPRRPLPGSLVVFCMEETFASIASRQLMTIEAADAFASMETGEAEQMRFHEDVHVQGSHPGTSGYCVWIEEVEQDLEF